jgi:hypothetical protein
MQEISAYTFTYEAFPEAMGMLWKRMLIDSKQVKFLNISFLCYTV